MAADPRALRVVAALTAASGALQVVAPGFVLDRMASRPDRLSRHVFATVGMFMVVSGGTLLRALHPPEPDPGLIAWSAAQKFGSSGLLAIGISRQVLWPKALPVAAFDLASGLLCLSVWGNLRRGRGRA
jgi:hypothetical protein